VLAITTSEGALTPLTAAKKTDALLRDFYHEGIPVGVGRHIEKAPPKWRRQSEQIGWGNAPDTYAPAYKAADLIAETLRNEEEKVILICLGALTNVSEALDADPALKDRIERVIWYNGQASPLKGANYDADRASADRVLKSGIRVEIVSGEGRHEIAIDGAYIDRVADTEGAYAEKIAATHRSSVLAPVVAARHMKMWDDLAVVYLFEPELFRSDSIRAAVTAHTLASAHTAALAKGAAIRVLTGKPDSESRVFFGFPEDPRLYADDVASVMKGIIARHGHSEWRAGVLTNELHGHLGIYAIIGVKMGIRAREYFNIGVDDITVVTYAGLQPPVSCMNDGLQVSTGGTLGHGLISVATGEHIRPEATFVFKGKTLRMKLKLQYAQQIRRDVEEAIRQHGNLTEPYWEKIRELAIKYWGEFDRHEMFEMGE
jgi:pyrimidine-specific ribonucleoside hydrolase